MEEGWLTKDQREFLKLWATYASRAIAVIGGIGLLVGGMACMFGPGGFIISVVFVAIMFVSFMVAGDKFREMKRNEKYK